MTYLNNMKLGNRAHSLWYMIRSVACMLLCLCLISSPGFSNAGTDENEEAEEVEADEENDNPCVDPDTYDENSDWSWEGEPDCEYAMYTVAISSPKDGGVYKKDAGNTGSASASRIGEESGTTPRDEDITWSGDVSGCGSTSSDFTTSVGAKTLTASANGESDSVTVKVVELKIKVPAETQDGSASGKFEIEVDPADTTIDAYEWSYTVPSGAGRAPASNIFDNKNSATPIVTKAQWFAKNNNEFRIESGGDGPLCTYSIGCTVTVDGQSLEATEANWDVYVYKNTPTTPRRSMSKPSGTGGNPIIDFTYSGDTVSVTGHFMTQFVPTTSSVNKAGMLPTNTFYGKIINSHEGKHVIQWTSGQYYKDLFNVGAIYALFAGDSFTSSSNADLSSWQNETTNEIKQTFNDYEILCEQFSDDTFHRREKEAHQISNAVGPAYLRVDFSKEYLDASNPVPPMPLPVRTP